jgi:hypothetical protein
VDEFGLEEDKGDQFMAIKPWKGAIREPTDYFFKDKDVHKPPAVSL